MYKVRGALSEAWGDRIYRPKLRIAISDAGEQPGGSRCGPSLERVGQFCSKKACARALMEAF